MTTTSKKSQTYNHLKNETSPYLQQHATNPVNWYPWGPQPFTKAQQENKPIFLSIGYSTCHWCHVMAHESFEDPEIAHLLNKHFINIKVDREERPDIDHIYMNICNLMTGNGGWPLTIIMTPGKHPFFAATYLPKHTHYGQIDLSTLLPHISNLWKHQKPDLLKNAQQSIKALLQLNTPTETKTLTNKILDDTYKHLLANFDPQHGGFSPAPKFPTPHHLIYLLRYGYHTNTPYAYKMVQTTLEHMRLGGIYDHIGYGFHRYATDPTWLVPHFEKMLYDQALLSYTYTEAYHATHNPLFKQTSQEILKYVTTTLTDPHGGFYSAEDADSEGIEGKFYTWTYNELLKHLTQTDLKFLQHFYNVSKQGNYSSEQTRSHDTPNILHQTQTLTDYAQYSKQNEKTLKQQQKNIRQKLYTIREKRKHPHKDTKILTDWNGLMIASYAQAARIHHQPEYITQSEKALNFILNTMKQPNYELYHSYHNGKKQHTGYADDYAFIIWGLLELYQTTYKTRFLEEALHLNDYLFTHFWDQKNHGLYFYSDIGEKLIIRDKQSYDGAYPSSNSIHLNNLRKIYAITADPALNEKASQLITTFSGDIHRQPSGYTYMLNSMLRIFHQSTEIVIVGEKTDKTTQQTLDQMNSVYLPSATIIYKNTSTSDEDLEKIAPYLSEFTMKNNKTTIYICKNHQCKQPTNNVIEALKMLQN